MRRVEVWQLSAELASLTFQWSQFRLSCLQTRLLLSLNATMASFSCALFIRWTSNANSRRRHSVIKQPSETELEDYHRGLHDCLSQRGNLRRPRNEQSSVRGCSLYEDVGFLPRNRGCKPCELTNRHLGDNTQWGFGRTSSVGKEMA